MLELALSAGIMIACLAGTFQFGYTFYVYNQLVTAVGNGARYASMRPMSSDPEADKLAIRNMVVYGTPRPAPGATSVAAHLTPEQVDVDFDTQAQTVHLAIRNYMLNAVFAQYGFDNRPAVDYPYIGPDAGAQTAARAAPPEVAR